MSFSPVPVGTPADTLTGATQVALSSSVQITKTLQGTYPVAPSNGQGVPLVDIGGFVDSLSIPVAAVLEYISQTDCVHGLQGDMVARTFGTGAACSGVVANTGGLFHITLGTSATGRAALWSREYHHYSSGQGAVAMLSWIPGTPTADTIQLVGPQNQVAGFGIGYNGTSLSCFRRTGALQEVRQITITTGANSASNVTITLDGTAFVVAVTNSSSVNVTAREIAAATYANWTATATGAVITWVADWRGARGGAYTYAAGTTGSVASAFTRTVTGADYSTSETVSQAAFTGDKLDGTGPTGFTIDPTKLNVFLFSWAYLGTAPATIHVKGNDGRFHLVHRFSFANTMTAPNFSQPSFYAGWTVESTGGTTSITLKGASQAIANVGQIKTGEPLPIYPTQVSGVATGANFVPIISFRGAALFGGQLNYNVVYIDQSSLSSSSTQPASFVWLKSATLSGAVWTAAAAGSVCETDTTATAVSGGGISGAGSVAAAGAVARLFSPPVSLRRGETLTLCARVTSGGAYISIASITGRET